MTTATANTGDSLIRMADVLKKTGLSRSSIYRLIDAGDFPEKKKIMGVARGAPVAFSANEVQSWIEKRLKPAANGEEQ